MKEHTDKISKAESLLVSVFKSLGLPCDFTVSICCVILETDRQRAELAIWVYDGKITDQETILEKAFELAGKKPLCPIRKTRKS